MGANTENKIWYLARDGKRHGPLSDLEMNKLAEMGHLKANDLVWRPGFEEWRSPLNVFTPPTSKSLKEPAKPAESKVQAQKANAPVKETSIKEKTAPAKNERAVPQQTKKATPFKEDTFKWDIYYEGEDGPEFQYFKENTVDEEYVPELTEKRSFKKLIYTGLLISIVGGIGAGVYFYFNEIRLTSSLLYVQLTTKEKSTSKKQPPKQQNRIDEKRTQTAAIGPQSETMEKKILDLQVNPVDSKLQKLSLWGLLKREFPDWYKLQLADIEKMEAEKKSEFEINNKLTESLVEFRRLNAEKALAASTGQLEKIALAFIANLTSLEKRSVEDCYGYISNGELSPFAISLIQNPTEGATLHAQTEAVFEAVLEGQKSPSPRVQPQKNDYDLLAKELGNIGWSEADIQLFANPQVLSNSPPAKVCRMVREWFAAHLSIRDELAKDRLLFETLRPLVAG